LTAHPGGIAAAKKQKIAKNREKFVEEKRLIEKQNEIFLPDTGIFLLSDIEITGNKW